MTKKTPLAKKQATVKKQASPKSLIDVYIQGLPDWKKEIAQELRQVIRAASRELTEEEKWGCPCYTAGDKCVCGFMDMKSSVNFVLYRGAELDDPDGLIEGTGKLMRHVKLFMLRDIHKPAFTKFIKQSIRLVKKSEE